MAGDGQQRASNSSIPPTTTPMASLNAQMDAAIANLSSRLQPNSSLVALLVSDVAMLNASKKRNSDTTDPMAKYISVLMAILIAVSLMLNVGVFLTIVLSRKLRRSMLYVMFATLAAINVYNILNTTLFSLFCINDNGQWTMGDFLCRLNAFSQELVCIGSMFLLTLAAMERALGLIGRHLVTAKFFGVLAALFAIVPVCFATPVFLPGFPVSFYPYRYLCAIGRGSPILYSVAQVLIYGGCLFVLLLCFGSILKRRSVERTLPVKPQDYGAFIMESRALEEHMTLSRAVLLLTMEFLLIQGPYICLAIFNQLLNSSSMLAYFGSGGYSLSEDAEMVSTLVMMFHPLFVPLLIFASCSNVWTKFVDLVCCRRCSFHAARGRANSNGQQISGDSSVHFTAGACNDHVLTLYATPDGLLQLHIPENRRTPKQQPPQMSVPAGPQQQEEACSSSSAPSSSPDSPSTSSGGERKRKEKLPLDSTAGTGPRLKGVVLARKRRKPRAKGAPPIKEAWK